MRLLLAVTLAVAASPAFPLAQERPIPNDSTRITIPGCARGRTFIIAERRGHEPASRDLLPGRRFRLSGPRGILDEIGKRERMMVEVTGLVRKSELAGPGGITIGGVRIGGGPPRDPIGGEPTRSPQGVMTDAVLDVEGWTALPEPCPERR
jgi:hypothetical protein